MTRIALKQFHLDAEKMHQDSDRRTFLRTALAGYATTRQRTESLYQDWQGAREHAANIKWHAVEQLPDLLEQFEANFTARGGKVHWAQDDEQARQIILDLIQQKNATRVIKSKSMATEEIHLNPLLESKGLQVIESDLGEFIVQLNDEAPYHFVFPSMHLKRGEIKKLFAEKLKDINVDSDDPQALTMMAREVLRDQYLKADIGISGGNFIVADTGHIAITENEGNARLSCAVPKTHIALIGIEKIIPRLQDLALLQPMLGTAGAGQLLTGYNTIYGGPKQEGEPDGPEEMHVVLLDNGRSQMLADPHMRDALRCFRCGACLNACPIFKNIGGHAYGATYQGPIGSILTPNLSGMDYRHLAQSSTLCGACTETCPLKIDLHHHLLRIRQQSVSHGLSPLYEKLAMRGFAFASGHPTLYRLGAKLGRMALRLSRPIAGSIIDPLAMWRRHRTLPHAPKQSVQEWWSQHSKKATVVKDSSTSDTHSSND